MFQRWGFLLVEIWVLLALAALLGLFIGWLIWGRSSAGAADTGETDRLRNALDACASKGRDQAARIAALEGEVKTANTKTQDAHMAAENARADDKAEGEAHAQAQAASAAPAAVMSAPAALMSAPAGDAKAAAAAKSAAKSGAKSADTAKAAPKAAAAKAEATPKAKTVSKGAGDAKADGKASAAETDAGKSAKTASKAASDVKTDGKAPAVNAEAAKSAKTAAKAGGDAKADSKAASSTKAKTDAKAAGATATATNTAAKAEDKPKTLDKPRDGKADDLKLIKGVGPKLEALCHKLGFYHFDQIANWTAKEIAWVDENLEGFKGRVTREEWVQQARDLMNGLPPRPGGEN